MKQILIFISTALALCSPLVYTRSILKGEAKPHRVTRFILLLITSLTTASLFTQNDQVAIWLAAASTLQAIWLFILSFRYGMGGWAKVDIFCLIIALLGIISWQLSQNSLFGLYLAILADFIGMVPTLIKTYKFPETEFWLFNLMDTIAAGLSLLALSNFILKEYSYPLYIMLINLVMVLLIERKVITEIWNKARINLLK